MLSPIKDRHVGASLPFKLGLGEFLLLLHMDNLGNHAKLPLVEIYQAKNYITP